MVARNRDSDFLKDARKLLLNLSIILNIKFHNFGKQSYILSINLFNINSCTVKSESSKTLQYSQLIIINNNILNFTTYSAIEF